MLNFNFRDKTVWVTGSSKGIGKAIVKEFAQHGAKVAISYLQNEGAAETLRDELQKQDCQAMVVKVDVADPIQCQNAYDSIVKNYGKVDILVNSAGVIADNLFVMLADEDWKKVLDTNLMGSVYTSRLVIKDMMSRRWGRIINLSSVAANRGGRGNSNYAASKAAIEAMTRGIAAEVGRRGITVNCIAPGVIETDMSKEVINMAKDEILNLQIIKRFGRSEEIAAWALMLASEYGEFMTGQTIHVDGGLKMA